MQKILFLSILLSACAVSKKTNTTHSFVGDQVGCGNFMVYKLSEDNREYLSISFKADQVEYKNKQSFGVDKADFLEVRWKKFGGEIHQSLCNDVIGRHPSTISDEVALSGLVDISLSEGQVENANNESPYIVTIVLRNIEFESSSIDYLRIENVNVGWLPG